MARPPANDAGSARRCAAGQPIDYRTYAGRDHVSVVAPDSPLNADLVAWTADRFRGVAPAAGRRTTPR